MVARWADLLVDYCLRVERGRDDRAQLERARAAAGRGLLQGDRAAGRASARAARDSRAARVLPRAGERGPAGSPAAGGTLRGSEGRGADPDRGRERHPLDEPGRPARQATFDRARDPIRQAARHGALGLDPVPDGRLRRSCRHDPARIRRVRHPGHVPRSSPTRRPPGKSWAAGRPAWSNSWPASRRSASRPTGPT